MAKRDKLTKNQKRQVATKQQQKRDTPPLGELSDAQDGLIISRYGEQADVLSLKNKSKYRCYLRQNLGAPVPGDRVSFSLDNNDQGIVLALHERESVLERPAQHQGVKPVVANINQVFVVVAPLPDFSSVLLDRYLIAVRLAGLQAVIVANKWDLQDEIQQQNIAEQLEIYRQLNYPVILLSTKTDLGLTELADRAKHQQSILVGQSGVGKSSIINRLFPDQKSGVNEISSNSRLGQHTTTASQLFLFSDCDGFIIDSPGIREFGLWHLANERLADGFVEFEGLIGGCKFRDCRHTNEPGCTIIQAVKENKIASQRWQNYCRILQSKDR